MYDYTEILGPSHLIYITSLALATFLLFRYREFVYEYRRKFTIGILIVSLAQQVLLYSSFAIIIDFDLSESLPFHLSRINTLIGIIYLITGNRKLQKFILYFSVFAWLSFLYPVAVQKINHPLGVSFLVNHIITLLLPFYNLITQKIRLQTGERNKVFMWLIIYTIAIYFFNPLVDGNYFYLVDKPVMGFLPDLIYIPLMWAASYILFMIIEFIYRRVEIGLLGRANRK